MSTTANHQPQSTDLIAQLLSQTLTGAFDSLKEKVTANVQENGEEYLQQAVEKIKESTAGVVAWAKENPVKTALAVAALAGVSLFLVKVVSESSSGSADTAAKGKTVRKAAGRAGH